MNHFYHIHLSKKGKKKEIFLIDTIAYMSGIISPFMMLPQLYGIWVTKNASGISVLSFASFAFFNLVFIVYGITHKNKLIIINSSIWFVFQIFVVIGVLLYKQG